MKRRRKQTPINFRIDAEMREYLERMAAAHQQSLTAEVEERIWTTIILEVAVGAADAA